jgi:uncharacterized delta-60 repeat protein
LTAQQVGTLDSTFDFDGKVTTSVTNIEDRIFSLAIQTDDKIIAGGSSKSGAYNDFTLAKYTTNGSLDSTFGTNGLVITSLSSTGDSKIWSIDLQKDGKIIAAGETFNGTDKDFAIVRYNNNGSLDNSFGINGIITINFNNGDWASAVKVAPSGYIYIAGTTSYLGPTDIGIARLDSMGNFDTLFNGNGIKIIDLGGYEYLSSIDLQTDGKIILGGSTSNGSLGSGSVLIRLEDTGIYDSSFNNIGFLVTNTVGVNSTAIQVDGKIVAAGGIDIGGTGATFDFSLARFNSDGSIDSSFNGTGTILKSINTGRDIIKMVKIEDDGKIIAAGFSQVYFGEYNFAIVRYNLNGTIDNSFGNNGITVTSFTSGDDLAFSMAIQSDFKIVLGGETFSGGKWNFALARYFSGLNVSVAEFPNTNYELFVFPNPIIENEIFFSHHIEDVCISLYDCYGRIVQRNMDYSGSKLFLSQGFKPGIYFMVVANEKILINKKIILN